MSTLEKLSRSTLVAPPAPPPAPPVPDRMVKVTTLVPLYRQQTLPVSQAMPGDEIVSSFNPAIVIVNGVSTLKYVLVTFAIRRVLIGYNTVVTYQVVPGGGVAPPAPPPTVVTPVPSAWDATAWSIATMPAPLEATWKVGASTALNASGSGALVGLTYFAPSPGEEQQGVIHGIRVESGFAYVHTAPPEGVPTPTSGEFETLAPFVDVTAGSEMKIRVEGGRVYYYAGGVLMARHPSLLGANQIRMAAVLYSPEDTIVDPVMTALAGVNGTALLRIAGTGGEVFNSGVGVIRLFGSGYEEKNRGVIKLHGMGGARPMGVGQALIGISGYGWGDYIGTGSGEALLKVDGMGGDYPYAFGVGAVILMAYGNGAAPNTDLRTIAVQEAAMDADVALEKHGGHYPVIEAETAFDATVITGGALPSAVNIYAKMRANFVHAVSLAVGIEAEIEMGAQRVVDVALLVDVEAEATQLAVLIITASLDASADVEAGLDPSLIIDAKLDAIAEAQIDWAAGRTLNAIFSSLARAGVVVHIPGDNLQVWSVNDETSGSTSYEQYPFNSFACIDGRYFGAAPGGIYELVGETDDGEQPIEAYVNLGKRDFDSNALKGISNAYLSVASEQKMVVRVTTPEGQQYTYEARRADDHMRTQRVDFGRGLRAHYLGLEIMNTNGADFDLEAAQFLVAEFKRRI